MLFILAIYHLKAVAEEIFVTKYLHMFFASFELIGVEEKGAWDRDEQ